MIKSLMAFLLWPFLFFADDPSGGGGDPAPGDGGEEDGGDAAAGLGEGEGEGETQPDGSGDGVPNPQDTPAGFLKNIRDEALRSDPSLKNMRDLDALAKSFVETKKLAGSMTKIPGKDASREDTIAFFKKFGGLDDPAAYDLKKLNLPEGLDYSDAMEQSFRQGAAGMLLTQSQAEQVWNRVQQSRIDSFNATVKKLEDDRKKAEQALVKEAGGVEQYQELQALAERAVVTFGGRPEREGGKSPLLELLEQYSLVNHPVMVAAFGRIGRSMADDQILVSEDGGSLIADENYEATGQFKY